MRPTKSGFELDARRVVPISLLAKEHPEVKEQLRELLKNTLWHTRPVYEYYALVRSIEDREGYNEEEKQFCRALEAGPLMLREAAEAGGTDIYHLDKFERLESEGIVMRSGLTPTDFMHLAGDMNIYDTEAARLAAAFLMRSLGFNDEKEGEMEKFAESVYEAVKRKLYRNVVRVLLQDKYPKLRNEGLDRQLEELIDTSWDEFRRGGENYFSVLFRTKAALVGIGAPIHIFLPDVAKALGTRCIIPDNAGVANAVGAVVGNINAQVRIEVRPNHTPGGIEGYFVCAPSETKMIWARRDAVDAALELADTLAREEARKRGIIGEITVRITTEDKLGSAMRGTVDLGTEVIATAIGGAVL